MLQTFIITFFIILICITAMVITALINGKEMHGSCSSNKNNPCDCTIKDRVKCSLKNSKLMKS